MFSEIWTRSGNSHSAVADPWMPIRDYRPWRSAAVREAFAKKRSQSRRKRQCVSSAWKLRPWRQIGWKSPSALPSMPVRCKRKRGASWKISLIISASNKNELQVNYPIRSFIQSHLITTSTFQIFNFYFFSYFMLISCPRSLWFIFLIFSPWFFVLFCVIFCDFSSYFVYLDEKFSFELSFDVFSMVISVFVCISVFLFFFVCLCLGKFDASPPTPAEKLFVPKPSPAALMESPDDILAKYRKKTPPSGTAAPSSSLPQLVPLTVTDSIETVCMMDFAGISEEVLFPW